MNRPDKQAIALGYKEAYDVAPKIKAKGKGYVAQNMIDTAHKHDIPIQEDPSLLELLGQLEVNDTIPEELYEVVSELLAFVYRLDRQAGHKKASMTQTNDNSL